MSNVLVSNLKIAGDSFDRTEDDIKDFLNTEMWPDTTTLLLESYERAYGLPSTGSTVERRGRVISAIRNTGGLSKQYIEDLQDINAALDKLDEVFKKKTNEIFPRHVL